MKGFSMLRNGSLKDKLLLTGMLTTGLVLLFASLIFLGSELAFLRHTLINDLESFAKTTSANSIAPLTFEDRESAEETLQALSSISTIIRAVIYDVQGNEFAAFRRAGDKGSFEKGSHRKSGYYFGFKYIDYYNPIVLDWEQIGTVCIRSDLTKFYTRIGRYGVTLIIIMVLGYVLSYFLFSKLHRAVTKPIFDLTDLMYVISKEKDYSLRAKAHEKDELGYLGQGFNEMLEKIHDRDVELADYRAHLEELVEKRTAELTSSNQELEKELAERIRVEAALLDSEHRYRTIFETTGNASVIMDKGTTILMVNSAFERLLGRNREEVEGTVSLLSFVHEDDLERVKQCHYTTRVDPQDVQESYEYRVIDRDGNLKDVYMTAALIPGTNRSIASLLDITDRKRLEEQLMQSQKMEAIGQLAGGVAHDFNNILTVIIGYGNLIEVKAEGNEKLMQYISPLLASAEKASKLTQSLLAFSRKQTISPKPIDLNETIQNVKKYIIRLIGEDIEMTTQFTEKDMVVFADPGQIEQVLINFATNARDAMPQGGIFSIETNVVAVSEEFYRKHRYGKPGRYALVSVSDTGIGISKKNMEHIFEPFFTTKEVGKGTGLGLSIIYGIVKQNGGYINAYSEPNKGSVFKIYLPLITSKIEEEKTLPVEKPRGGNEVILLAEDDEQSRTLIKEILEEYGYTIIEAVDGEDAVSKYKTFHQDIQLIIMDVVMPKKNGKAAYEEIKRAYQDVRALFISGYTADIIHKKGIFEENINFLSKPIMAYTLLAKMREILDNQ